MARKSFARTVVQTICEVTYIDQNNDRKSTEVTLYGDYDLEHAQRPAIRELNAKGGIVTSIKHTSFYGTMSMERFAKLCEKTNYKEW